MGFGWAGIGAFMRGDDVAGATADTLGGDAKVFGKRPKVAKFRTTSLEDEQKRAVDANLANADSIAALLDKMIPGFSGLVKQGLDTSGAMMRGEIPDDVMEQIMRNDAFKSVSGGFDGTSMARNLTARDLGLTSLDLIGKGQNAMQSWTKLAETSADPFIIKTMEQAGTTAANNAGEQATEQFQNNVKASPDPAAAAKFAIDSAIGMKMMDWGLGMAGGAMGGGGGGNGMPNYAQSSGTDWRLYGGTNGGALYQYNASTGRYESVPRSTWGGT